VSNYDETSESITYALVGTQVRRCGLALVQVHRPVLKRYTATAKVTPGFALSLVFSDLRSTVTGENMSSVCFELLKAVFRHKNKGEREKTDLATSNFLGMIGEWSGRRSMAFD
jgi:hypothetical protein